MNMHVWQERRLVGIDIPPMFAVVCTRDLLIFLMLLDLL